MLAIGSRYTYRPSFTLTTSPMRSLSRSGNMPAKVLGNNQSEAPWRRPSNRTTYSTTFVCSILCIRWASAVSALACLAAASSAFNLCLFWAPSPSSDLSGDLWRSPLLLGGWKTAGESLRASAGCGVGTWAVLLRAGEPGRCCDDPSSEKILPIVDSGRCIVLKRPATAALSCIPSLIAADCIPSRDEVGRFETEYSASIALFCVTSGLLSVDFSWIKV